MIFKLSIFYEGRFHFDINETWAEIAGHRKTMANCGMPLLFLPSLLFGPKKLYTMCKHVQHKCITIPSNLCQNTRCQLKIRLLSDELAVVPWSLKIRGMRKRALLHQWVSITSSNVVSFVEKWDLWKIVCFCMKQIVWFFRYSVCACKQYHAYNWFSRIEPETAVVLGIWNATRAQFLKNHGTFRWFATRTTKFSKRQNVRLHLAHFWAQIGERNCGMCYGDQSTNYAKKNFHVGESGGTREYWQKCRS